MVSRVVTTLKKSPNSHTQYLVIPAAMAQDSQYPFAEGQQLEIVIDPMRHELKVRRLSGKESNLESSKVGQVAKRGQNAMQVRQT